MHNPRFHTLSLSWLGDQPPTEFRLFVQGWNDTENGRYLFDEAAGVAVMAAYRAWGVDIAIDLEHQMLSDPGPDPTARDARGWCKLELRSDGSLWAVDVKWTPDGAERLSQKRQRYVSPAFEIDTESKRVTKILNVAITAMPATHKTPALVAANTKGAGMDPKLIKQALDAIEAGDQKAAAEILKNMIAAAAGAEPEPDGDEGEGAEGDSAEGQPAMSSDNPPPASDSGDGDGDSDGDAAPAKKKEQKAARVMLAHMTGKESVVEQLQTIQTWKASHLTLEIEQSKLARERATLESAERRQLCVDLVKLGAEFPATVWANDKAKTLKPRWLKMPIEELRSHVADQKSARGGKASGTNEIKPAAPGAPEVLGLSAEELKICEQLKCDPKTYAALRNMRDGSGKKGA